VDLEQVAQRLVATVARIDIEYNQTTAGIAASNADVAMPREAARYLRQIRGRIIPSILGSWVLTR